MATHAIADSKENGEKFVTRFEDQQALLPSDLGRTVLPEAPSPRKEWSLEPAPLEDVPISGQLRDLEYTRGLLTETTATATATKTPLRSAFPTTVDPSSPSSPRKAEDETAKRPGLAKPCGRLSEMQIMAYATSLASVAVFIYECIAYNAVYLGRILPAMGKEAFVLPFGVLFNFCWFLAMWSYVAARKSDPGRVSEQWRQFVRDCGDTLVVTPARLEWQPGRATLCRKCASPRPERAHHCHVCGVCVLRMDHHCPWLNNCVGFKNHKFFLLLVIYSSLSALTALVTSFPELVFVVSNLTSSVRMRRGDEVIDISASDKTVFLIFAFLALFFLALLAPMLAAHLPLLFHNITTIEGHYDNIHTPNPFDRGSAMSNMSQVFGKPGFDWLIPIYPLKPVTDGVSFPSTMERIGPNGMPEVVLMGEEMDYLEKEALWRVRYGVRPSSPSRNADQSAYGPLSTITRWWSGSPEDPEFGVGKSHGMRPGC